MMTDVPSRRATPTSGAAPRIRDTHVSVLDVVAHFDSGGSEAELVALFPEITRQDIEDCRALVAEQRANLAALRATLDASIAMGGDNTADDVEAFLASQADARRKLAAV